MRTNRDTVAQLAGVSSATVSRAYNHPERVDELTLRKVREAADKIGYVPDKNASALRRSGSGTIMFCQKRIADLQANRYYKWFYADILLNITTRLEETPYRLRIQQYDRVDELKAVIESKQADAIIAFGVPDPHTAKASGALGVPYVCGHQLYTAPKNVHVASVDEHRGGAIAGEALLRAGCRFPAHITGELRRLNVCDLRWEGFKSSFPNDEPLLINEGLGIQAGRAAAAKLIPFIRKGEIDCVFVVNDLTALGVVQVLLDKGIRIPDDISIISYDNLPFIDALPVRLTTVDIDMGGLYRQATGLLLDSMRTGAAINLLHSPFLVPGDSIHAVRLP